MPGDTDNLSYAKAAVTKQQDASCGYDDSHGYYKEAKPAVQPGRTNEQIPAPFKLGGG